LRHHHGKIAAEAGPTAFRVAARPDMN